MVAAIHEFGFDTPEPSVDLFIRPDQIVRLGVPPVRVELLTAIAGVEFDDCFPRGVDAVLGGVPARFISLADLKRNKRASGRHSDLDDLENLP